MIRNKLFTLLPVAAAVVTWADCPDGSRNTTAAEQAFYSATVEALAAAVPAAPAGWELKKTPVYKAASSVCKGTDSSQVVYSVRYSWTDAIKEQSQRFEEMQKKVAEIRRLPEDKAAQINELAKQSRALRREWTKARAEKNTAEAERLEKEFKALDVQGSQIKKGYEASVLPKIMEITQAHLEAEKGKTYQVSMTFAVNEAPYASKPGGPAAKVREGGMEISAGTAKPVPGKLQHQNVVVRWTGDTAQVEMFAKSFDKAILQTILRD
jgi:alanyl-tRNA synthetase